MANSTARKLAEAKSELLDREQKNIEKLAAIIDGYLKPMRAMPKVFSEEEIKSLFANIEDIYKIHVDLITKLHSDEDVITVFKDIIPSFRVYELYATNFKIAVNIYRAIEDGRSFGGKTAKNWMADQNEKSTNSLDLALNTPLSHVGRYPQVLYLFTKDIPVSHPLYRRAYELFAIVEELNNFVQRSLAQAQSQSEVDKWQHKIESKKPLALVTPGRSIVAEVNVEHLTVERNIKKKGKPRIALLLTDLICIITRNHYKFETSLDINKSTKFCEERSIGENVLSITTDNNTIYLQLNSSGDLNSFKEHLKKLTKSDPNQIYGVDLDIVLSKYPSKIIPDFLERFINFIEDNELQREGIYRESGSHERIEQLMQEVDNGRAMFIDFKEYSGNDVAVAIKKFFFKMPVRLFPQEVTTKLFDQKKSGSNQSPSVFIDIIKNHLPKPRLRILQYMLPHWQKVVLHSETNRMTPQCLAIVFAPSVFHDKMDDFDAITIRNELLELFINCADEICKLT